ncbi:MAG: hypothetical protein KJO29_12420 [Bacteroidia bacterium]|nr:hypothetical protein [Bacteroidia bacterium]
MNNSLVFQSKSQYGTKYFYVPFLLTGISLGILFIRFLIGHIYEFENWLVIHIGKVTIVVFLIELLLLKILGKYHSVIIRSIQNEMSIELVEDTHLVVRDTIKSIDFFWDYFSKSPITDKEFKEDRGYLYQRLLCEIDTNENGKFWLSHELLFFQDAPASWDYKQLDKNDNDKLYTCSNLKQLKKLISKTQ